jgi:hypothetical protein
MNAIDVSIETRIYRITTDDHPATNGGGTPI